jgi:hypothetical protein
MKALAWLNAVICKLSSWRHYLTDRIIIIPIPVLLYTVALNGLIGSQVRVRQAPAETSTPPDNPPVPPHDIELASS